MIRIGLKKGENWDKRGEAGKKRERSAARSNSDAQKMLSKMDKSRGESRKVIGEVQVS